jgi:hypothetical protein
MSEEIIFKLYEITKEISRVKQNLLNLRTTYKEKLQMKEDAIIKHAINLLNTSIDELFIVIDSLEKRAKGEK